MSEQRAPHSGSGRVRGLSIKLALAFIALALFLSPIVWVGYFNAYVYPQHGLEDFTMEEYEAAIERTASLFAGSIGYEVEAVLSAEMADLAPMGGQFAWGVAKLRGVGENAGLEQRLWVSLKRLFGPWRRASANVYPETEAVGLLVDPRDELFFLKKTQPAMYKLSIEADRLWREQQRRLQEYYGGYWDGEDETTP